MKKIKLTQGEYALVSDIVRLITRAKREGAEGTLKAVALEIRDMQYGTGSAYFSKEKLKWMLDRIRQKYLGDK